MSPNTFEDFQLEAAEETTLPNVPATAAKNNLGECTSNTASILVNEGSHLSCISDNCIPRTSENGENNCTHLHKELDSLKKLLAENEVTIELQNNEMENLWVNWCIASQQNQELVQDNAQLLKELTTDREKSKLLMHEYKQMSAVYKVKVMELEETVAKLLQQLQDVQETRTTEFVAKGTREGEPKHKFNQCKNSSGHRSGNSKEGETCLKLKDSLNEETTNYRKTCLSRRSDNVSCKEASLMRNIRREEQIVSCPQMPSKCHDQSVALDQNESLDFACSLDGAGVSEELYNNVTMDVPCHQDFGTIVEDVSASKESTTYLENSYICTRQVDQSLEIKQKQQQLPPPQQQQQPPQRQQQKQPQSQPQQQQQEQHQQLRRQQVIEQAIPCNEALSPVPKETQASRRSSIGRPARKAKVTVASYKEIPLKTKMRRSE